MVCGWGWAYAAAMPDKKLTPEQIAANRQLLAHVRDWMMLSAPTDTQKAARYRQVAEIAAAMPDDALQEWLALGRRLAGGGA